MTATLCRHCRTRKAPPPPNTRRGLCWACSTDPEIREMYPSESKYQKRGDYAALAGLRGPMTQKQIADVLGVTRHVVSAIERSALRKLRGHPMMLAVAADYGLSEA